MAFVPLNPVTTVKQARANVRARCRAEIPQKSKLLTKQVDDAIYDAMVYVKQVFKDQLWQFYWTDEVVTQTSNVIDISALVIEDIESMSLVDSSLGKIEIYAPDFYEEYLNNADSTTLASTLMAKVTNTAADTKLGITIYKGSSLGAFATLTLTYQRIPTRFSTAADKLDIPENFVSIVKDKAIQDILSALGINPPPDIAKRLEQLTPGVEQ